MYQNYVLCCINDTGFDNLVSGVQSHKASSEYLSLDIPDDARDEKNADEYFSGSEVGETTDTIIDN